jgi:hypothetical protein
MRFSTDTYDGIARRLASQNPNMLVPWWLMAAFMYEVENDPFLSDGCFDWLSAELFSKWDEVEHRHKTLIDRDGLRAGTGLAADLQNLPTLIKDAARHLVCKYANAAEIGAVAFDIDDLLGGSNTGIDDLL